MAITRRYFFFGSLLAGAVPPGRFCSARSLKHLGYKSPNEKLNLATIGGGARRSTTSAMRKRASDQNRVSQKDGK